MSPLDRTLADYAATGLTVGPHLMRHLRDELARAGVLRACDLPGVRDGRWVKVAGVVIVRQRPGTAKGMCFLTLEDETGLANAVVSPDIFRRHRSLIHTAALLLVEGPVQRVVTWSGRDEEQAVRRLRGYAVREEDEAPVTASRPTANRLANEPPQPVIHVRARRLTRLMTGC